MAASDYSSDEEDFEVEETLVGTTFPTKKEMDFFEQFAEIEGGIELERTTSETLVLKPRRLMLKNLHFLPQTATLDRNIGKIFDIFIRHMLEKAGGDLETTNYWLNLRHPGYLESGGFWIFHKTYKMANGHTLINLISKHCQSPNSDRPELGLDENMTISMRIFKKVDATGKGGRIPEQIMKKFGLRTPNVVGDGYCLPKALILGQLWSDYNSRDSDSDSLHSELFGLTRADRAETSRPSAQLRRALELLEEAGVEENDGEHDLTHLARLADYLEDYKIVVWHLAPGAPCPTILVEFNKEADGLIPIFYANKHFEFFKPTTRIVNVFYCFKCNKLVKRNHERKCKKVCKRCGDVDCKPAEKEEMHCEKCNNTFHSKPCFERHLKKKDAKSMAYCQVYEKCTKCFKIHERESYHNKHKHRCFHNYFCNICMQKTRKNHKCSHAAPTDANRKRQLEKQNSWAMVIYDIESVVVSSSEYKGTKSFGIKHVPNVICFKIICHKCMGRHCSSCGEMQTLTYNLRPGETGTVLERFAEILKTDSRLANAYVIAHNGGRYDHVFVLEQLVKSDACKPHFIMSGSTFIMADVPISKKNVLHFRDTVRYIPMRLDQLPDAFSLKTESKGHFPYLFNHPDNYGKVLSTLPPIQYYEPRFKKPKEKALLEKWYEENKDQPFDFDKEIVDYCKNDVQILVEAAVKYMELCQEKMNGWNPFIQASTLASYVMFVMKHEHIEDGVVGYLPENGYGGRNNSRFALKYLLWLEKQDPNLELQHTLRTKGEFYALCGEGKGYHVDGYNEKTNEIYEIHGCLWHGCTKCFLNRDATCPRDKNVTMYQLYERTLAKDKALREAGYTLHVIWECEIKKEMDKNPEMKTFFRNCQYARHLRPREAMYGGRTQQFKSLVKASPKHSIEYFDFCSLYPYVNIRGTSYPKGNPERITDKFEPIKDNTLPYRGVVFCDILPPATCPIPVLPMRANGKLLFVLCRTCGQSKKSGKCTHTNASDRYLTGVWCTDELNVALQEGYQVLKLHEVWHWPDDKWFTGGFFASFMAPLLKMKHEASGWPRPDMTDEEKTAHIDAIRENDKVNLDINSIEKNPALRSLAKLFLNSTWGKFAQNPCKAETTMMPISNACAALDFITYPGFRPQTFEEWNETYLLLSRKPTQDALETSKYTNIVYGALTTSAARLKLYQAMKRVGADNIIYCDTDSIVFLQERGTNVLGDMRGDALGQLTDETPSGYCIDEIVIMAPKVYSIKMLDISSDEKYSTKAKGVTLNNETADIVNFHTMKRLMLLELAGTPECFSVRTMRMKRGSNVLDGLESIIQTKRLRRVVDKGNFDEEGVLTPFGLTKSNVVNDYPFIE